MNPADVGLHRVKVVRIPVVVLCLLLAGCASVVRNPVPEADHRSVTVLDNPDVRQWGDGSGSTPLSAIKDQAEWEKKFGGVMHTEHNYLVMSGGGPRGAYGAGVLTAWTKTLRLSSFDAALAAAFVDAYRGRGPEHPVRLQLEHGT